MMYRIVPNKRSLRIDRHSLRSGVQDNSIEAFQSFLSIFFYPFWPFWGNIREVGAHLFKQDVYSALYGIDILFLVKHLFCLGQAYFGLTKQQTDPEIMLPSRA